ncbi:hypothetical protein JCM8097_001145 [Rhodosporidiobolus ruineniae]
MPDSANWGYKTTLKPAYPSSPSLVFAASAPLSPSKNTLLASSSIELRLTVSVGDEELEGEALAESALARDIQGWLQQHKDSLGLDGASSPTESGSGVTIRLNAFSRSARSSALSLSSSSSPEGLSHLSLSLVFRPASSSASKPTQSSQVYDSQNLSSSLPNDVLHAQLLNPSSLHFTLSSLVTAALERLAKKLAVAFPLCFNPKWVDRLTNDLPAQRSIAKSLTRILHLDAANGDDESLDPEIATAAALHDLTLTQHLTASFLLPSPPSASSSSSPAPPPKSKDVLSTALLVLAKEASAPDAWAPTQGGTGGGKGKGPEKVRGKKGKGKRRRAEEAREEDRADTAALTDFAAADEDDTMDDSLTYGVGEVDGGLGFADEADEVDADEAVEDVLSEMFDF